MAVYKDNNGTWYISVRYVNWKGEHCLFSAIFVHSLFS